MKLKDGYITHDLDGDTILLTVGDAAKSFNGMVRLNETAAFLVERLKKGTGEEQLVDALLAEYDVQREDAAAHVKAFLKNLDEIGALDHRAS